MVSEKNVFNLLSSYINKTGQSEIQLNSFNHFINFGLQSIIDNDNSIDIDIQDKFRYQIKIYDVHSILIG